MAESSSAPLGEAVPKRRAQRAVGHVHDRGNKEQYAAYKEVTRAEPPGGRAADDEAQERHLVGGEADLSQRDGQGFSRYRVLISRARTLRSCQEDMGVVLLTHRGTLRSSPPLFVLPHPNLPPQGGRGTSLPLEGES